MHSIENSVYCYISGSRHYNTTSEDLWPMTVQTKVNVTIIKKWWRIMPGFDSILIWKAKRKDGQSSRGKDGKAQRFICSNNVHVHTYKSVHSWCVGRHIAFAFVRLTSSVPALSRWRHNALTPKKMHPGAIHWGRSWWWLNLEDDTDRRHDKQ